MENSCPKNYLVQSILVTIFCCLPLGIVGIVKAAKVNGLYAQGLYEEAVQASNDAKKFCKIGLILGLVGVVLYAVYMFVIIGAATSGQL